jgi:hypothetical protein
MPDLNIENVFTDPAPPPCPLCGGEMIAAHVHAAVARVSDVFRCKRCHVEYPVTRKDAV